MRIFRLIYVLYKIKLLDPSALFRLTSAILTYGVNLMALLNFAARTYRNKTALVDEREVLSYGQLLEETERLSFVLRERYKLAGDHKVGFLCKNHASLVKAIYAVSSTGADLYLLNAEMSGGQLNHLVERHDFDLMIYDEEYTSLLESTNYADARLLSYHDTLPSISNLIPTGASNVPKNRRTSSGRLVLLTGGTTGAAKAAAHKPSLFNYLNPFYAFLSRLNMMNCHTAYIATPIYHGYGIAVLLLLCAVGKKVVIQRGFDAERACQWIREHQAEAVTVVPIMLSKMLKVDPGALASLCCIASGGAELSPNLVRETQSRLGEVLYNLYGTSEAGLNMIATPKDLACSASTIGRKIQGSQLKIVNSQQTEAELGEVGRFCIRNSWSMMNGAPSWIETGDLGYQDERGLYFLCGRADSMVVSGGENVYPLEVEQIICTHPQIIDAAVIGVSDELFGQRLKVFVQLEPSAATTEEELREWLRPRLARFQMPRDIVFVDQLPYTSLGKLDRKRLK
jgi:fatty-acyl-CoA synthase